MNYVLKEKAEREGSWGLRYLGVNSVNPNVNAATPLLALPYQTRALPNMSVLAFDSAQDALSYAGSLHMESAKLEAVNFECVSIEDFNAYIMGIKKKPFYAGIFVSVLPAEMFVTIPTGVDIG